MSYDVVCLFCACWVKSREKSRDILIKNDKFRKKVKIKHKDESFTMIKNMHS